MIRKVNNPNSIKDSQIHKTAKLVYGCQVVNSSLGKFTYAAETVIIHADIGAFCSIASGCIIGGASHPLDRISTSPVFHAGRNVFRKNYARTPYHPYLRTTIGNDVWLGSRALVKSGVHIGDGAVVGMGSVVTKDVQPYSIVAGNPARHIRYRFDEETIQSLQELKWWNFSDSELKSVANRFDDIKLVHDLLITMSNDIE